MPKASDKQLEYAKFISETLGVDMPKTNDRFVIGAFIHQNKDAAIAQQQDNNQLLYDRIKREIPITDIAKEMGYHLKRDGRYYTLEEHDSVHINPEENLYIRASQVDINNKGSVIDFMIHFGNMSQRDAIERLAERLGTGVYQPIPMSRVEKEKKEFVLPPAGQNMRNVFAYLTQSRYIEPDIVQYFVDRKMIYQDKLKNCVFVSYRGEEAVFGCLKGTNTFTPFAGDIAGSDYEWCWYLNNGSDRLHVTEAPIDTMSRMTMYYKTGIDLQSFDYLALSGAPKYKAVIDHAKANNYKEIIIGTDRDKGGDSAYRAILKMASEEGISAKIMRDSPIMTKDWNEEMKYLFMKGYRFQDYIEPTEKQLEILNLQMEALCNADTQQYQLLQMQFPLKEETSAELRKYMFEYLEKNYEKALEDFNSGSKRGIKEVLKNYNKQIPLTQKKTQMKLDKGIDIC